MLDGKLERSKKLNMVIIGKQNDKSGERTKSQKDCENRRVPTCELNGFIRLQYDRKSIAFSAVKML